MIAKLLVVSIIASEILGLGFSSALTNLWTTRYGIKGSNVGQVLAQEKQAEIELVDFVSAVVPQKSVSFKDFKATAKAAIALDVDSNKVLYSKAENVPLPIASLTKIMTAVLAIENLPMNRVITVKLATIRTNYKDEARMRLFSGEKITVNDLLHGVLIGSAADAAKVVAEQISGSQAAFVAKMNAKAQALGMKNTHYADCTGMSNYSTSTVHDLAVLCRYAMRKAKFREVVVKKSYYARAIGTRYGHLVKTTNLLLDEKAFKTQGIKTGTTDKAGQCLALQVNSSGKVLVSVVLGSKDRFAESKKMILWARSNYVW